jgi:hypothetical protein
MADCFEVSQAHGGELSGLEPLFDRALRPLRE